MLIEKGMDEIGRAMMFLGIVMLLSFVGMLIGRDKGQANLGMLLGLFLGPLGWLITGFLPNRKWRCPHCQGVVPSQFVTRCKNCGGDIDPHES